MAIVQHAELPTVVLSLLRHVLKINHIPNEGDYVTRRVVLTQEFAVDALKRALVYLAQYVRSNFPQISVGKFVDYIDIDLLGRLVPRISVL